MGVAIRGQVALITGAGRGIGEEIAYALAREGCQLALTALEPDELARVAARCEQLGARSLPLPHDLRSEDGLGELVDRAVADLGPPTILINNAGAYHYGPIERAAADHWDEMLQVNLRSAMRLTRLCMPHILEAADGGGRGVVVFISSQAARRTFHGGAGYCASKVGLDGFAGALFEDVGGRGVKVCVIHPDWVNTRMVEWMPFDRAMMIQPGDVAELVRMVATWPQQSCPREIHITAQQRPRRID